MKSQPSDPRFLFLSIPIFKPVAYKKNVNMTLILFFINNPRRFGGICLLRDYPQVTAPPLV